MVCPDMSIGFRVVIVLICALVAVAAQVSAAPAAESSTNVEAFVAQLDDRVPRWMERAGVPGVAIALVRRGEVVWTGAFGDADVIRQQPMTPESICRAESISKSVTAWGVMTLVDQGLVDLDTDVEGYLGSWELSDSKYDESEVTVRRLLSGNAGMQLGTIGPEVEYEPGSAMPPLREHLSDEALVVEEPGSMFIYSNPGFNLLQLLVEEVSGLDFADYMHQAVLSPLGMDRASYAWQPEYEGQVPNGYELDGTPVPPYVYPAGAAGGLFADVADIARFVAAEMVGPYYSARGILRENSINLIHEPQVEIGGIFGFVAESYGFGHFIETLSDGRRAVWHGGQGHGWMTHFHAVPESGDGIVILTNSNRSWPFLARVLADWSRWNGFAPVKFSRITYATVAVWVLIGVVAAAALLQLVRLVLGIARRRRRPAPLAGARPVLRTVEAVVGVGLVALVIWRASLPYVFETSIFPVAALWIGVSLVFAGLVLIASALMPKSAPFAASGPQ